MKKYKIKDIADEISVRVDDPKTSGFERFVGLEHYDSGKPVILRYGSTAKLDSSAKVFKNGDILIARRNVYLKRAGLVEFDGITSGDSIVIRAKNKRVQRLLPFIFNTVKFWDYADQHADGSMSKRLSPKILMEFEVTLPDSDAEIDKLADLLWSMYESMHSYEEVISKSDELIKSQFIEMFDKCAIRKKIGEIASISRGASPRPISKFITDGPNGENWIKIGDVGENDMYVTHANEKITKEGAEKSRRVNPGDFILSNSMSFGRPYILKISGYVHDGWLIISEYQKTFQTMFFYHLLRSDFVQSQFNGSANGSTVKNLNSDIVKRVEVITPSNKDQNHFIQFANQIDKSKFIYNKMPKGDIYAYI